MPAPRRHGNSAITTFNTGVVYESHVGKHAVVIACGPGSWNQDPSVQLIAFGEDNKRLWSITVQVARLCVGPTTRSSVYSPTVLLAQVQDRTTGRKDQRLGTFPIERLLRVMPVDEDDIDLRSQYTHLHAGDANSIRMTWNSVVEVLFNLGKEVASATCRIGGKEVFAEGGEWTDDMSRPLTEPPRVTF